MAINLYKGQIVDLKNDNGEKISELSIVVNWTNIETVIKKKRFLGLFEKQINQTIKVDIDLSCVMIDNNNNMCDHIYSPLYRQDLLGQLGLPAGKLISNTKALIHTGDDLDKTDTSNNEKISIDLSLVPENVEHIFFFINCIGKENFSEIPSTAIKIVEEKANGIQNTFAEFQIIPDSQYEGKKAIIVGEFYKKDNQWKFNFIEEAYNDAFIGETVVRIKKLSSKK